MRVKIYGSRASTPFSSGENQRYGGNTACVRVDACGRTIILDGGTGIAALAHELNNELGGCRAELDILIGHLHLDHIIGLPLFAPLWERESKIRVLTKSRNELPLSRQVLGVFEPPYWPVPLYELTDAQFIGLEVDRRFTIAEGVEVMPFEAEHCDGTTGFRIEADKTLVYLLDFEVVPGTAAFDALCKRCENADAVIFDATYMPEDYRRGWGHSTYECGMRLAERSGCGKMVFSHLSQSYSDALLDNLSDKLKNSGGEYILAYDGIEFFC